MATYLLAWNPKRWNWEDLDEESEKVRSQGLVDSRWSVGNSKRVREGDRLFFIGLGVEPRGIFASGTARSDAYEDDHWDEEQYAAGKTTMYVDVEFDTLLNPRREPILPRSLLNDNRFQPMQWDTRRSGITIPDAIAAELEREWSAFLQQQRFSLPEEVEHPKTIYEGAVRSIAVNSYERSPEARRKCIEHYATTCTVCGFDFAATYGGVAEGLIHVHHMKELSEIGEEYEVDPINDLRPVCPNCHAVIHRRKPAYSLKEVKAFLWRARQ